MSTKGATSRPHANDVTSKDQANRVNEGTSGVPCFAGRLLSAFLTTMVREWEFAKLLPSTKASIAKRGASVVEDSLVYSAVVGEGGNA